MSFLQKRNVDENGNLEVFVKKKLVLETNSVMIHDEAVFGKARVKYEKGYLTSDDVFLKGSLEECENYILQEGNLFWKMPSPPLNHIPEEARFAHRIANAKAKIFSRVDGIGKITVVFHPSNRAKVESAMATEREPEVRYFEDGSYDLVEHESCAKDSVLVLYHGADENDYGLFYVEGCGLFVNNRRCDSEDYGKFVRIP